MPNNVSALNQTSATTRREMDYAGWDPQFQVPVTEPLGYYEESGVGYMKRVAVSADGRLLVSGSTGGGTLSLADDAASNRVSAFQTDAGNLRVSSLGGSFSLSADASGNRVSALSNDADQLRTSSISKDAGLMRVSAVGGTAGDNTLVDGSDQSVSARLIQVSAVVSSNMNTLLTRMTSYDAANARVSALQSGTWSLSALLGEGTAFAGNVSATVKNYPLVVSGQISANVDSGSVSAKQGNYPWSVSGNVSTAINEGTNFLGNVSATLKNYPLVVSGTVSTFINQGTVSARQGTDPWIVSGTVDIEQAAANLARISAFSNDAGTMLISARLTDKYVSATIDNGSISAKSGDANQFHVSAVQGDAGLLRVSADILTDTTNNGLTTFYLSAVSTTVTAVKASAGRLYGWAASNNLNADHTYSLVWDNAASAVTPGTTAPKMSLPLPPSGGLNLNVDKGIPFTTAISIAAVSANNGGSNPDTAVPVTIWYK